VIAEVGVHAQLKGRMDAVDKVVKTIEATPLKKNAELKLKALVAIARAATKQGRGAATQKLLLSIAPLTENLEWTENTGDVLKNFALAFAATGNIRASLQQVAKIQEPYFITHALIEFGLLCAKRNWTFADGDLALLNGIVRADLPAKIQAEKFIEDEGWEIPGLAQSRMLRPPELQRTRDQSIQLYYTYYEPEIETFIKRPFRSRRKPKPDQGNWISKGLKVSLIEEHVINGHKFCYRLMVYEIFQDKQTGLPKYQDNLETLLYYDEDGDGKFETLEEGLDYFARGHIPKWVLEK
jgi:hypothetical protein